MVLLETWWGWTFWKDFLLLESTPHPEFNKVLLTKQPHLTNFTCLSHLFILLTLPKDWSSNSQSHLKVSWACSIGELKNMDKKILTPSSIRICPLFDELKKWGFILPSSPLYGPMSLSQKFFFDIILQIIYILKNRFLKIWLTSINFQYCATQSKKVKGETQTYFLHKTNMLRKFPTDPKTPTTRVAIPQIQNFHS